VLKSYDTPGGPGTNGVMLMTKKFRDANPKVTQAVYAALSEDFIDKNPGEARRDRGAGRLRTDKLIERIRASAFKAEKAPFPTFALRRSPQARRLQPRGSQVSGRCSRRL
jgi:hypothetical protein